MFSMQRILQARARFDEMAKWLDMDERKRHKETIPAIFTEASCVDGLCHSCQSIPWSDIRRTGSKRIEQLEKELPKKKRAMSSGSHQEKIYEHMSMTAKTTADMADAGCHFCSLVLFVLFSRAHEAHPMQKHYDKIYGSFPLTRRDRRALGLGESLASWDCTERFELVFSVGRTDDSKPISVTIDVKVSERHVADTDLTIVLDPAQSPGPDKADRQHPSTLSNCRYWLDQ